MNSKLLDDFTKDVLETAKRNNTYRTLRTMETPESSHVKICVAGAHASSERSCNHIQHGLHGKRRDNFCFVRQKRHYL